MPITKSALKALRRDKNKTIINKPVVSRYKNSFKKASLNPSLDNLKKAFSAIDRAVKKKVIHKNKAARLKSKLGKLLKSSPKKKK